MKGAFMQRKRGALHSRFLTAAGYTLLLAALTALLFDYYFDLNDDVLIKDILAGVHTGIPSGYCIQMLYPVSVFISFFYRLAKNVDWYGLFLCGSQYLCVFLLAYRSLGLQERAGGYRQEQPAGKGGRLSNRIALLVLLGILSYVLFLWELVYVQYTVTCGLLVATAVFLLYTTPEEYDTKQFLKANALSILFLVLAFSMRTEMFMLLLPLVGAAGMSKWIQKGLQKQSRKYGLVIALTAAGTALSFLGDFAAYRSPQWQEFRRVFDARTQLYDFYGIPKYGGHAAFYESIGMGEAEYTLLQNYNYGVDDTLDADRLEQIEAYARKVYQSGQTIGERLREAVWEYRQRILGKKDMPFSGLVLFAYVCVAAGLICSGKAALLWQPLFLLAARSVSWFYILYRGRVLSRITVPLYLTELLILLAIFWQECHADSGGAAKELQKNYARQVWRTAALTLAVFGVLFLPDSMQRTAQEQQRREEINLPYHALQAYCKASPEKFFYVDVYSTVSFSEKMFEKVDNSVRNYDIIGGWACKSPISGFETFRYFITDKERDVAWLKAYYAQIRPETVIEKTDEFCTDSDTVWEVYQITAPRDV